MEKSRAIGLQTDLVSVYISPDVAGQHGTKNKKMDIELTDLCRLQNARKSDEKSVT